MASKSCREATHMLEPLGAFCPLRDAHPKRSRPKTASPPCQVLLVSVSVLTTVDHPKSPKARRGFTSFAAPITIGRDVWIGANCTVFPGVTIGDNVIIGPNSVVNRDVPSNSVVAGAPIRLIRKIEDDTEGAPAAE